MIVASLQKDRKDMAYHAHGIRGFCSALLLCGALALLLSQPAAAQDAAPASSEEGGIKDFSPKSRPQMVSVFTGIHYGHFAGYGFPLQIGGRYYMPIVPDGFLPSLNDEFGLEFGLDFTFTFLSSLYNDSVLLGFGVPADAVWDFHFSSKFDAYAKLGLVFGTVFTSGYDGFWWTIRSAVRLRLKLTDTLYFRAEVGYPSIMAGLGFAF